MPNTKLTSEICLCTGTGQMWHIDLIIGLHGCLVEGGSNQLNTTMDSEEMTE